MDEATATTAATETITATSSDRTKEERQAQVKPILEKLTELKLYASKFAAVKDLMVQIQDYIKNGGPQKVNIAFPEFGRRIKGTLETNRHVESSVKL
jgi:phosphopantetheine adenylyltransferase